MLKTCLILTLAFTTTLCYSQQEIQVLASSKGLFLTSKADEFIKIHYNLCKTFTYNPGDTIKYERGKNAKENYYSLLAVNKSKAIMAPDEDNVTRYDFRVLIKKIKGEYYVVQMYCPTPDLDWKLVWEEYPR